MSRTWVLVTVRGRPKLTTKCVDALIERTAGDRKLFVVDNGSRDAALDYLYKLYRKGKIDRLLCNRVDTVPQWQKSYAICQAVHALRMESYEYFAWVDNDVEVRHGWLEVAQKVLIARSDVQVASMHNDQTQEKHHKTISREQVAGYNVHFKRTANGAAWVVRREFFDMYGLPPTGLGVTKDGTEDWYYSREMEQRGIMFAVLDGFSVHHGYKSSVKKLAKSES